VISILISKIRIQISIEYEFDKVNMNLVELY